MDLDRVFIREATIEDALGIGHVHVEGWQTAYRKILPDGVLDNLSAQRRADAAAQRLREPHAGESTFVAEVGEQIVGFAMCGPARDEVGAFGGDTYDGELYGIYLLSSYRGRGIGRALVLRVAESLIHAGCRSMYLWVLKRNPARGFYEALGGTILRQKMIHIVGVRRLEVAYGWPDARILVRDVDRSL